MKSKRPRKAGPGKTLPKLAETYAKYISESTLRRAVERGDLHVVEFAGLRIVTPREEQRFCTLLEIPFAGDAAPEACPREGEAASKDNATTSAVPSTHERSGASLFDRSNRDPPRHVKTPPAT